MVSLKIACRGRIPLALLAIGLLSVSLRLVLLGLHWPIANADESIIDLMARHVAYQGDHPLFFWGQYYMGTIQAYLGAMFMHIFGSSAFSVRLGTLLLFALYLVCLYLLVRLLYTPAYAFFMISLLSIGSNRMMSIPLIANGGYAETMFFAAFIFFLAGWLALTTPHQRTQRTFFRLFVYGVLGVTIGLALWSDQLILAAVVAAGLLLCLRCYRELRGWATVALLLGLLLGSAPLSIYNLSATPGNDSLSVLLKGVFATSPRILPFSEQIAHVLLISLPLATGFPFTSGIHNLCATIEPYTHPAGSLQALFPSSNPWLCIGTRGGWSMGILLFWAIALVGVFVAMRKLHRQPPVASDADGQTDRRAYTLLYARLMLLVAGAIWLVLFLLSAAAQYTPRESCRYLICLLLVAPAILWPLWQCVGNRRVSLFLPQRYLDGRFLLSALALCIMIGAYLVGIGDIVANLPADQMSYNQINMLIQTLLDHDARAVYSDYDTCSLLMFQSDEHVLCGVLTDQLRPGFNRYRPYWLQVFAEPHPAYLFPLDSTAVQALHSRFKQNASYQCIHIYGYIMCYARAG